MDSQSLLKAPIFVALDVDDMEVALQIAEQTSPYVGGFKVGPRLVVKYGQDFTKAIASFGPLFMDNKYYDIPSTMEAAVRASFEAGASFVTIHAGCGREALERMARVEQQLNQQRSFKILAVTVLTSFSESHRPDHWDQNKSIEDQVMDLATVAIESGISGIVCSSHEVQPLRQRFPQSFLVTPGIRLPEDAMGDQKRVNTPKQAMQLGASAMVVGRPICAAKSPGAAAKVYAQSLAQ